MPFHRSVRVRALLAGAATAGALTAVGAPGATAVQVPVNARPHGDIVATDPGLRFTGRWDRHHGAGGDEAATVNSGSAVSLRFTGDDLTALLDVSTVTVAPQIWVTVDNGPRGLVTADRAEIDLTPQRLRPGAHTVRIDVKDTDQVTNRWVPPLQSAVVLRGFRLADGARLLPPPRPEPLSMAFYGDSITEGIRALGMPLTPDGADGTRTYAALTARAFGAGLTQVGFGKQGVMRPGVGNVPSAPESFGYDFQGVPAQGGPQPDVVVLLQGSNDSQVTDEEFAPAYLAYLRQVRASAPHAWILAMEPLIGRHALPIHDDVTALGDPRIAYVSTDGWLDRTSTADYTDTVHPTVAGHLTVAEHLVPIVRDITGLTVRSAPVQVTAPPVTAAAGHPVTVPVAVHINRLWAARRPARGRVVVTPPAGFTTPRTSMPFTAGPDGRTDVTVLLRGTLTDGATGAGGEVRILVDGQTETLPVPLTVVADSRS
ncbi:GDSL-type esterase/lipase family protein [Streptomyces sp. NPDC058231]|uniref:GDSL-type esterase/lipase family protein n=1 Tax=Streptomyces sp. NPDC058231 TaxID=3346392 RepID=UPI0036E369AD